ncbi:ribosomal protein S5 domain 2-type protein [Lipomyces arxii]|uniref:ribosomal protein S5 domain 2-type protein n=1 Tax=Lipomyces arxii TaxID=56418 RepID=UPI0034CFB93A
MVRSTQCFSAPGKALLAGGYLVLDAENSSFVTALSARIYALTSSVEQSESLTPTVTVTSPQFKEGEWSYSLNFSNQSNFISVSPTDPSRKNPFVSSALTTVINYLASTGAIGKTKILSLAITILSDNAYHSQPNDSMPRFNTHSLPINAVPKTGLGSSAALTTSIVAALMSFYDCNFQVGASESKSILHNLAQVAHCNAQGKVGSGFDVASAVYGSITYRRFAPTYVSSILQAPSSADSSEESRYLESLKSTIESSWTVNTKPCAISRGLRLLMGDVSGGSETPSMVQMVQKWRKEGGESARVVWKSLGEANEKLIKAMVGLGEQANTDASGYDELISKFAQLNSFEMISQGLNSGKIGNLVAEVVKAIQEIRSLLRAMTAGSGAQIEPAEQTVLLDACSTLPGVLGGVVPGAGGYDAVCLVVCESAVDEIVKAKSGVLSAVKWLDLREEASGVREEDPESVLKYL